MACPTQQTIFLFCVFPKKILPSLILISNKIFPNQNYNVLSGFMIFWREVQYYINASGVLFTYSCTMLYPFVTFFIVYSTLHGTYTDKKEKKIFLIYKEIQKGAVAKSYIKKGCLIYEAKCTNIYPYMRRPLVIYCMSLQLLPSEIPYI